MKPADFSAAAAKRCAGKAPSQKAILRSVASSTAIETGKSIRQIEESLRNKNPKRRKVTLAK